MNIIYLIIILLFRITYSVTLYSYKKNQIVSIKNNFYRESINSQYFVFRKYYYLTTPKQYTIQNFNTKLYFQGSTLKEDYIINGHQVIGNITYYYHKQHYFHYIANIVSSNFINYTITHNNKIINKGKNKNLSIYNNMLIESGYHNYLITLYGNNICNCPSMLNGYKNTRFFAGWIMDIKENKTQIYNTNLDIKPIILIPNIIKFDFNINKYLL